jgi:L-ascorbate metabolism protein UlaG (beta-lactamase superfamily)
MSAQELYFRQNVKAEPLFNRWYAWPCLLPPANAAMYIANSHLKIMQSFVAAPQVHVTALKNPAMRGGPFINYDAGKAPAIRALMEKTSREQAHMLKFAAGVQELNNILEAEADGSSLEPLYQRIPDGLKGYVELVYDLNNNPSIRFIEGLLYKSPYYNLSSQSVALSHDEDNGRPFILSTPQVAADGHLYLDTPFNSESLDELFRMKFEPRPLGYIRERLNVAEGDGELFASFFTAEPPRKAAPYAGDGVRVRYFGHACLLIETKDVSVICDPVISYQHDDGLFRYSYADLPERIDYLLITHNHQDHCMFETLLQLRHRVRNVVVPKSIGGDLADPSLKLLLRQLGFKTVYEIEEMESLEIEGGHITGLPFLGEHADMNVRSKIAHLVCLKGRQILCAADSNNIEPALYERVHELTGDVDAVFLGMECDGGPLSWLYGPLLSKPLARKQDQSRRFDGSDYGKAIDIVNRLRPSHVYVYAMGQEPWLTYLTSLQYTEESRPITESNRLVEECRRRGLESERLYGHKEISL